MVGAGWRLALVAATAQRELTRDELLALPQHTYDLPIACVEGWSTTPALERRAPAPTWRRWSGAGGRARCSRGSLQPRGAFRQTTLGHEQSPTTARCSRCASTAPTCRSTTATRRASSSPRCRACTARSGCRQLTLRARLRLRRAGLAPRRAPRRVRVDRLRAEHVLRRRASRRAAEPRRSGCSAARVLHDLVLLPLYSLGDRILSGGCAGARSTTCACRRRSPACCCSSASR